MRGGGTYLNAPKRFLEGCESQKICYNSDIYHHNYSEVCMKKNRIYSAFTLAEMMVVMLILSIVMAAFAPVVTTRQKSDRNSPWRYSADNSNIYYGLGENQTAMIGQPSKKLDLDPSARLLISTSDSDQKHIVFKQGENSLLGSLHLANSGITLGSNNSNNLESHVVIGNGTLAAGEKLISIGTQSQADDSSTSVGYKANAKGTSTAVGYGAKATSRYSTAIGGDTQSGHSAEATGEFSSAYGNGAQALADTTTALGSEALANQTRATALGSWAVASGQSTVAAGYNAKASATQAVSIGYNSEASGASSTALGYNAKVSGSSSIAAGNSSKAEGKWSAAYGYSSKAIGDETVAVGDVAEASEYAAVAMGYNSKAQGANSISIGYNTKATSTDSIALGYLTTASGESAIAIGSHQTSDNTTASGSGSVAIGDGALASGAQSIAIGTAAKARGTNNVAIGQGACSNVIGSNKTCIGAGSGPGPASDHFEARDDYERIFIGKAPAVIPYSPGEDQGIGKNAIVEIVNYPDSNQWSGKRRGYPGGPTVYINANVVIRGYTWLMVADDRGDEWDEAGIVSSNKPTGDGHQIKWNRSAKDYPIVSDKRLKYVGNEVTSGLDKIKQLKVFNYTFKSDKKKIPHVGVIAQDLQKVFPEAVKKGDDGYYSIRKEDIFYALVNAVKEIDTKLSSVVSDVKSQAQIIKQLQDENKALKARVNNLEKRLDKLEKQLK